MTPQFFHTPSGLRAWLEANHASSQELWLRLRKTTVPGPGVTYSEALDLALCFGWIDGVRHAVDGKSFAVRFTPRKPKSIWSKVNSRHYQRLERTGSVTAAGREAFQRRQSSRAGRYSFESAPRELPPALERTFRANPAAWAFFMTQPPSYRRTATFWVLSAKNGETRERRLAQLIRDSSHGQRLEMLRRPASRKPALALAAIIGCCWLCAGQSIPPWFPAVPPLPRRLGAREPRQGITCPSQSPMTTMMIPIPTSGNEESKSRCWPRGASIMAAVLLALSASASPHNPDTDWFHDAGWGVFVHYLWDVRPVDFVSLRNSGYFA
jgi:uncharacterized protein YdeI (YjbR/CyaY-like superfamily)